MNMSEYLDMREVLVYEIAGGVWVFFALGMFAIWYLSIKAKAPLQLPLLLSVLFSGICFTIAYNELLILWFLAVLGTGVLFYYGISKLLNR